jgi:disulfide oxidoreductase YuzD
VSRRRTDNTRVHQYPWVSSTHGYWWTLVLSVCLLLTDIDYLLYCLSVFYSRILMNSCIVCPSSTHRYWWTLVLSVRLLLTGIDYLLYWQYKSSSISVSRRQIDNTRVHQYLWVEDRQTIQEFINIRLMNSCIVCPSSTHGYWWTLVLSVRLLLTGIDYLLYCLSVFYSRILMNSCIVCPSSIHIYWLPLVLSVRLLLTDKTDNTKVHQYP